MTELVNAGDHRIIDEREIAHKNKHMIMYEFIHKDGQPYKHIAEGEDRDDCLNEWATFHQKQFGKKK